MTPVDQFLHSVQESFAENRATNWTKLGLLVFTVVALSVGLSVWMRRRRARRALEKRIHAVLSGAGLSSLDLGDLTRIAATGNLPLIDVMTVLASFEHATAALLAGETPTLPPVRGSWFERVRHLRHALGFSPLSRHLWLLTTRELVAGDSVAMRGINGRVAEVDEASFAVDWPAGIAPLVEGAEVNVTIDRVDDARYLARVRLLSLKSSARQRRRAAANHPADRPGPLARPARRRARGDRGGGVGAARAPDGSDGDARRAASAHVRDEDSGRHRGHHDRRQRRRSVAPPPRLARRRPCPRCAGPVLVRARPSGPLRRPGGRGRDGERGDRGTARATAPAAVLRRPRGVGARPARGGRCPASRRSPTCGRER